jgi:hypothetical protein
MNTAAAAPATTAPATVAGIESEEDAMIDTTTAAQVAIFNVQGQTLDQIARAGYTIADLAAGAEVDYDDRRDER